jgi:hypothetical protein
VARRVSAIWLAGPIARSFSGRVDRPHIVPEDAQPRGFAGNRDGQPVRRGARGHQGAVKPPRCRQVVIGWSVAPPSSGASAGLVLPAPRPFREHPRDAGLGRHAEVRRGRVVSTRCDVTVCRFPAIACRRCAGSSPRRGRICGGRCGRANETSLSLAGRYYFCTSAREARTMRGLPRKPRMTWRRPRSPLSSWSPTRSGPRGAGW